MALISLFGNPLVAGHRPNRFMDFDSDDDDDFLHASPCISRRLLRRLSNAPYHRRPSRPNKSLIAPATIDKDSFQVKLDVQQFAPEEIVVKVAGDDVIVVEAKHEEKEDDHGFISRQFVRKYKLPEGHDIEKVQSKLSTDGVLTITAPKVPAFGEKAEREIPISFTGRPHHEAALKNDGEEDDACEKNKVNGQLAKKKTSRKIK